MRSSIAASAVLLTLGAVAVAQRPATPRSFAPTPPSGGAAAPAGAPTNPAADAEKTVYQSGVEIPRLPRRPSRPRRTSRPSRLSRTC